MRALVIEPHIFATFMIEDALKDAGYTSVAVAAAEEEALAAAEAEPPDLVVAAVQLQPGSGIRAARAIRAKCDAAILFVTARAGEVLRELPGAPIVRKPFTASDLPPAIAAATGRRSALV